MNEFYRMPEEMKGNYQAALEKHGGQDASKMGHEKGVRSTAFITAKLISEYIPGSTGLAKRFYDSAIERIKPVGGIPDAGAPYFIELRYKSTEKLTGSMIERFGEIQVIELASGFTTHGLSMTHDHPQIKKWIDNDFGASLDIKQDIVNDMVAGMPIEYIPGSALDQATWEKFRQNLIPEVPVVIFCEGLMMYFTKEERDDFFNNLKSLLAIHEGVFFHEDLLKYQKGNQEIEQGRSKDDFACMTKQVKEIGGNQNNQALDEFYTQDEVTKEYESRGFKVERYEESKLATLSLDRYPEEVQIDTPTIRHTMHPRQNGEDLLKADFRMWVLSNSK